MTGATSIRQIAEFPKDPGVYLVYTDTRIGSLNWNPSSGAAYIGKADNGLRRRLEREHHGDTGRSTLRRTLGALLKDELHLVARARRSKSEPKAINFTNYEFEPDGDGRLTQWIGDHISVLVEVGRRAERELSVIAEHQPPLNLTGWLNPLAPEIKAARRMCADEARSRYASSR